MQLIEFLIIIIGIALALVYVKENFTEVEFVKSTVDGRSYLVRNMPDSQKAADLLARLAVKLEKLIDHMVAKYPDDKEVKYMKKNYDPENISEGSEDTNYTSYSVNKGEKIVFCIRSRDGKNTLVDENTLVYVAVHELAHLMTKEVGHTDQFWKNFRRLLKEAVKLGLYTKVNYAEQPVEYCGIKITSTVLN
jgi:predicted metal-dependent hydrolase